MEAIEAARALFPEWMRAVNVIAYPLAAFVFSLGITWCLVAVPLGAFRKTAERTWVEFARLAYPIRYSVTINSVYLPFGFGLAARWTTGPLALVPPWGVALASAFAAYAGVHVVGLCVGRRLRSTHFKKTAYLRSVLTVLLIFYPNLAIAVGLVITLPAEMNSSTVTLLAVGLVALVFATWGGGVLVAQAVGVAKPPSPRLRTAVDAAAVRIGCRPRATYEVSALFAQAYALPLSKFMIFTEPLVAILNDEELVTVCCHELGHLTEGIRFGLARGSSALLLLALAALGAIGGSHGLFAVIVVVVGAIVQRSLLLRMARHLELRADRISHAQESEPGVYARALEKIYAADGTPAVMFGSGVHPHLYDRMVGAGVTPNYPRPGPPSRRLMLASVALSIVLLAGVSIGLQVVQRPAIVGVRENEHLLVGSIALTGGHAVTLSDLALIRFQQAELGSAIILWQAATEMDEESVYYPANLAIALAADDRCDDAEAAVREAEARLYASPTGRDSPIVFTAQQSTAACRARHRRASEDRATSLTP